MPIMVEKNKDWIPHPAGAYYAEISGVRTLDTQWGDRLMWTLETGTKDEDGNELSANHFTGLVLSNNSKLTELVEVATGKSLSELPDEFDAESIIGSKIQIHIVHEKREDGSVQSKIQGVFPIPPQPGTVGNAPASPIPQPQPVQAPSTIDDIPF